MGSGRASVLLLGALGCGQPGPAPIAYGSVPCHHCHMTVADPRFGAELVSRRRKVFVFDDPGCMAAFVGAGRVAPSDIHSLWVNDFLEPDSMLDAREAVFIRSASLRTPMNSGLAAVRPGAADSLLRLVGGLRLTWDEVLSSAAAHVHGDGEP